MPLNFDCNHVWQSTINLTTFAFGSERAKYSKVQCMFWYLKKKRAQFFNCMPWMQSFFWHRNVIHVQLSWHLSRFILSLISTRHVLLTVIQMALIVVKELGLLLWHAFLVNIKTIRLLGMNFVFCWSDNHCKTLDPGQAPTFCRAWIKSELCDTLTSFNP